MTAKTVSTRVAELRARRQAAGLVRLEVYAHPLDHPAIKAMAERLQKLRADKNVPRDISTRSDTVLDGFVSAPDPVKTT